MSRAFVKNDASDDMIVVPKRAPLPAGATNYVTPRGLALLREELALLEAERARIETLHGGDEGERSRQLLSNAQRIKELVPRIDSARVVDPRSQPRDKVCFGATVTVRTLAGEAEGEERRLTIVGVDEANPSAGVVSFLSPIAKAVIGAEKGDTVSLRTAKGEEVLEVVGIERGEVG